MNKEVYTGAQQLSPCPAVLVTGGSKDDAENVITIAWTGILSSKPEYISVAIRPERYSYGIIKNNMELGINIPKSGLAAKVDYCGVKSGRDVDKFKECNFTKFYCDEIKAPLIEECFLNIACKVEHILDLGAHHVFISKVLKKYSDKDFKENMDPLVSIRPYYYKLNEEKIMRFGESIK